ncbi:ComF family protein [Loigolactobacillus zhaoyuanensis]|uniref:ComF family protein n=1 Tax=Loigolactobacillus zhaoyuanensis TaxID=2486017 RepID=A0ABW8UFU2_9LACO|nr:ComF family protein [Loigolactobacillus zhaoyuanensis]
MNCLLCQQSFSQALTLADLLYWRPLLTERICSHCQRKLQPITIACPECGRAQNKCEYCRDCQRWLRTQPDQELHNHALFVYNAVLQDFFKRYKSLGDYRLRQAFNADCQRWFRQHPADVYIPIPTDTDSYTRRGFNPVVGLYAPCVPLTNCLKKRPQPIKQAHKKRQARLRTPQLFYFTGDAAQLSGKRILLLDDIYTTGRTMRHAQACLKMAVPNCQVNTFTLAR